MHVNREILDGLLAAALVLLALARRRAAVAGRSGSPPAPSPGSRCSGTRASLGSPLVLAGFLLWRRGARCAAAGALVAAAVLVLVPWVVRNEVEVGCSTITTDARALWKANNEQTYDILARGGWIDDVPRIPGSPLTPEEAVALYRADRRASSTSTSARRCASTAAS